MIFKEKRNCLRIDKFTHYKLLIDGENFFNTLQEVLAYAKETIYIHAWEIDTRLRLNKDSNSSKELKKYLVSLVKKNPKLNIYIMCWDFSYFFAFEREFLLQFRLNYFGHDRIHFCYNKKHALGGSNHQKCIVIDDSLLFLGGLDVTKRRYDSRTHSPDSSLRYDPKGEKYGPFHDIQVLINGDSAKKIGEIFREDWFLNKGERPKRPKKCLPWPSKIQADINGGLQGVISRTLWKNEKEKRIEEVKNLYIDMVESAKDYIYVESQYLTSRDFVEALKKRLEVKDNQLEVILVISLNWSGLLEKMVLGGVAQKIVNELINSDLNNKLRVYTPIIKTKDKVNFIKVHSKLLIMDDTYIRVGSSNLSERSMNIDSEVDFTLYAKKTHEKQKVRRFLIDLLSEHTGQKYKNVEERMQNSGLIMSLRDLNVGRRKLCKIKKFAPVFSAYFAPLRFIADPKMSISSFFLSKSRTILKNLIDFKLLILLVLFIGIFCLNQEYELIKDLTKFAKGEFLLAQEGSRSLSRGLLIFIIAVSIGVPLNAFIPLVALILPTFEAFIICFFGTLISAILVYIFGHIFQLNFLFSLRGHYFKRVTNFLENRGLSTVLLSRVLPVAPFAIINFVSGTLKIPFRHYLIGTLFGILPGISAFVFMGTQVKNIQMNFSFNHLALLVLTGLSLILLGLYFKRVHFYLKGFQDVTSN